MGYLVLVVVYGHLAVTRWKGEYVIGHAIFFTTTMKRQLLSALLVSACICADAQIKFESDFTITPGQFVKDGQAKPILHELETGEVKILDSNMNVTKQFTIANLEASIKRYDEIAEIAPTEVTEDDYQYTEDIYDPITGGPKIISSPEELMQYCKDAVSNTNDWVLFISSDGSVSCGRFFINKDKFGTSYPTNYYCIDSYDNSLQRTYKEYHYAIDENAIESAEWTIEGEPEVEACSNYERTHIYDFDKNSTYDSSVLFTQTVLNDDEKWEYTAPLYGNIIKNTTSTEFIKEENGKCYWRRSVTESPTTDGIAIYNEDGDRVAKIETKEFQGYQFSGLSHMYKLDGKLYLECSLISNDCTDMLTILYLYDPTTSEIREISSRKSNGFCDVDGRTIHINAEGDAALFNMSGMKMASSKNIGGKRNTIDAGNIPSGVYCVSLMKDGKISNSQKIHLR